MSEKTDFKKIKEEIRRNAKFYGELSIENVHNEAERLEKRFTKRITALTIASTVIILLAVIAGNIIK